MNIKPATAGTLVGLSLVLVWMLSAGPIGFCSVPQATLLVAPGLLIWLAIAFVPEPSPAVTVYLRFRAKQSLSQRVRDLKEVMRGPGR